MILSLRIGTLRPFIFISLFHEPADPSFWGTGKKIKIHFKTFLFAPIRNSKDFQIFGLRAIAHANCNNGTRFIAHL